MLFVCMYEEEPLFRKRRPSCTGGRDKLSSHSALRAARPLSPPFYPVFCGSRLSAHLLLMQRRDFRCRANPYPFPDKPGQLLMRYFTYSLCHCERYKAPLYAFMSRVVSNVDVPWTLAQIMRWRGSTILTRQFPVHILWRRTSNAGMLSALHTTSYATSGLPHPPTRVGIRQFSQPLLSSGGHIHILPQERMQGEGRRGVALI